MFQNRTKLGIFPEHMGLYQTEYNLNAIFKWNIAVVIRTIDIFEKNVVNSDVWKNARTN